MPKFTTLIFRFSIQEKFGAIPWKNQDGTFVCISDNGSNCSLLSIQSFHIDELCNDELEMDSFDPEYTRCGLLGKGYTVVETGDPNKPLIGICVRNGIFPYSVVILRPNWVVP